MRRARIVAGASVATWLACTGTSGLPDATSAQDPSFDAANPAVDASTAEGGRDADATVIDAAKDSTVRDASADVQMPQTTTTVSVKGAEGTVRAFNGVQGGPLPTNTLGDPDLSAAYADAGVTIVRLAQDDGFVDGGAGVLGAQSQAMMQVHPQVPRSRRFFHGGSFATLPRELRSACRPRKRRASVCSRGKILQRRSMGSSLRTTAVIGCRAERLKSWAWM